MWLIVEENGHLVFDCHEVLNFEKKSYQVYDCDIDYSDDPTLLEQGIYNLSGSTLKLRSRKSQESNSMFFIDESKAIDFKIEKLTKDSLIISYKNSNVSRNFKFRKVK